MAFSKKPTNNKYRKGCGERGTLLNCWCECKLAQPLWKIVWRFLKNLEIELPYDPASYSWAFIWRKPGSKRIRASQCFFVALFTISKTWKQPKCSSTEEWIKKLWHIYTMKYYLAIKENDIMPSEAMWMDLGIVILSEVSQTEKENIICHPLHVESKRKWYKWTYLQNRKRSRDLEKELAVAGGKVRGWDS